MKNLAASTAFVAITVSAIQAFAGVVITQEQTTSGGPSAVQRKAEQTVMIQANKEKMIVGQQELVIDLDKGKVFIINPSAKTYREMDYPLQGMSAKMLASSGMSAMNFKRAGASHTVAGYKCEEFTDEASGAMSGDYTLNECVSKDAPGAAEYTAFQKQLVAKLKGSPMEKAMSGTLPEGLPLELDATRRPGKMTFPGLTAQQTEELSKKFAGQPPVVTKTIVTKVETQKLPEDTFAVPADFTKQQLPSLGGPIKLPSSPTPPNSPTAPAPH